MKIVNLETFKLLPIGTVFMKYEPCIFGDLQVKGDTLECKFRYTDLAAPIDISDDIDFACIS